MKTLAVSLGRHFFENSKFPPNLIKNSLFTTILAMSMSRGVSDTEASPLVSLIGTSFTSLKAAKSKVKELSEDNKKLIEDNQQLQDELDNCAGNNSEVIKEMAHAITGALK